MSKLPVIFQRVEGAFIFLGTSGLFFALHGNLINYIIYLIVIDLSIIGYLAGPRVGAVVYNLFHNYSLPLICIGMGLLSYKFLGIASFGLVWIAHIGLDRALGLGLKYPDSFSHTHLGDLGKKK